MRTIIFSLSFLLLIPFFSAAQNNMINNTTQMWSEVDLIGKMHKKWKWQLDIQYSRQSPYESLALFKYNSQLTLRPWFHYYVTPNLRISLFAGEWYNYAIPEVGAREYPEYRVALQTSYYSHFKLNIVQNRLRTEVREIKDRQGNFETVLRERYMLKYQHLLNHETYDKNSSYLIAFNEFFVNDGSAVTGYKMFDQNRVFLGIGYNLTDNVGFETGYFNQLQHHAHDINFDMNHNWQISLIIDHI